MTDASIKDLAPRTLEIFHELVTAYLENGLPVGSSRLAKTGKFDFSPASIRSKMSDLEEAGLLFAPHTSSGRVPTETGLRMFVDGLMNLTPISQANSASQLIANAQHAGSASINSWIKPAKPYRVSQIVPVLFYRPAVRLNYNILNLFRWV